MNNKKKKSELDKYMHEMVETDEPIAVQAKTEMK